MHPICYFFEIRAPVVAVVAVVAVGVAAAAV
jgi:hypothetical protein